MTELSRLTIRRADLQEQLVTIEFRMAREREESFYDVLKRQYQVARSELAAVEEALRRLESERATAENQSPELQAEAALGLLDDLTRITSDPAARAEVNALLQRLGLRIGLSFGSVVKGKKIARLAVATVTLLGQSRRAVPLEIHTGEIVEDQVRLEVKQITQPAIQSQLDLRLVEDEVVESTIPILQHGQVDADPPLLLPVRQIASADAITDVVGFQPAGQGVLCLSNPEYVADLRCRRRGVVGPALAYTHVHRGSGVNPVL
jgi:hypothetical protein